MNEKLLTKLPEDAHDTIGGYMFGSLHRIGRVGDTVEHDNILLKIATMRGRRVEFVDFTRSKD